MNKTSYLCGKIKNSTLNEHTDGDEFFLSYDYGRGKTYPLWLSKRICKIGEVVDELGMVDICIPLRFLTQNNLEMLRFDDIRWNRGRVLVKQ